MAETKLRIDRRVTPATKLTLTEQSESPTSPLINNGIIYIKSDKHVYFKDSNGTETQMDGGGSGGGTPAPLRFFMEGAVEQSLVGQLPKVCEAGTISKMIVIYGGLPSATLWDSSNYIEFNVFKADMSIPSGSAPTWTEISSVTTRINSGTLAGYYIQEFTLTTTELTLGDLLKVDVAKTGSIDSMGTDLQVMIYYDV